VEINEHLASIAKLAKAGRKKAARKRVLRKSKPALADRTVAVEANDAGAEVDAEVTGAEQASVEKRLDVEILKANEEEQTVSGVVLQPEVVDAQGDIMSADVIKKAAYGFLMNFNKSTKLGLQHSTFPKGKLALVESYVAPNGIVLGAKTVRAGSWIMTVKVLDATIWKRVKDGKITGFSIGGKATVVKLDE
jgi:hypothetical protein